MAASPIPVPRLLPIPLGGGGRLLGHQRQAQTRAARCRVAATGESAQHSLVLLGGQPSAVVVDDDRHRWA